MTQIPDPVRVRQQIGDTVLRYIDTQFWLRKPELRDERRQLLERDTPLLQDVLLEPVLPYDGTHDALQVCAAAGLTDQESRLLIEGLFGVEDPSILKLRAHQADALL